MPLRKYEVPPIRSLNELASSLREDFDCEAATAYMCGEDDLGIVTSDFHLRAAKAAGCSLLVIFLRDEDV